MEICDFLKSWKRMCNLTTEMNGCEDCTIVKNTHGARCGDMPCEMQDVESIAREVEKWAAEHPEPQYPTWAEWLLKVGAARRVPIGEPWPVEMPDGSMLEPCYEIVVKENEPIPADIAQKLGIEPKEG